MAQPLNSPPSGPPGPPRVPGLARRAAGVLAAAAVILAVLPAAARAADPWFHAVLWRAVPSPVQEG